MRKICLSVFAIVFLLITAGCDMGSRISSVSYHLEFIVPGKDIYSFNVVGGEVPNQSFIPDNPVVDGFVFEGWRENTQENNDSNVFLEKDEYDFSRAIYHGISLFATLIPESWAEEGSVYRRLEAGDTTIEISTAKELKQLSEISNMKIEGNELFSQNFIPEINSAFEGVTIVIKNDIDMTGTDFMPLSGNENYFDVPRFSGTIEGDGGSPVEIKGLDCCLIATSGNNTVIRNLKLSGSISGDLDIGGFVYTVGENGSLTIDNCISAIDITAGFNAGGFVGSIAWNSKVNLTDLTNEGDIVSSNGTAGGIIGDADSSESLTFDNLKNTGNVTSQSGTAGGIIGVAEYPDITISDVSNSGDITGVITAGGIIGRSTHDLTLTNASVSGDITAAEHAGGLIGEYNNPSGNLIFNNCTVTSSAITASTAGAYGGDIFCASCDYTTSTNNSVIQNFGNLISQDNPVF